MNLRDGIKRVALDVLKDVVPSMPARVAQSIAEDVAKRTEHDLRTSPPAVAIIGEVGVGKSSTLNVLFNAGLEVGNSKATTQEATALEINIDPDENGTDEPDLIFYDLPGLGESVEKSEKHRGTYGEVLKNVDVAVWVLPAIHGPMESMQLYIRDELSEIKPELLDRMVFALNKVDLIEPRDWSPYANIPSPDQARNIEGRVEDLQRKIVQVLPNWRGHVIPYSAAQYYNLHELFEVMLLAAPSKRRWMIKRQARLAKFRDKLDRQVRDALELKNEQHRQNSLQDARGLTDRIRDMSADEFRRLTSNKDELAKWIDESGLS